jgi:hypothetical protein
MSLAIPPPTGTVQTFPLLAFQSAVMTGDVDIPTLLHVVVDEVLQQELIDSWARTLTSHRPDVVGEDSNRPGMGLS